MLCRCRSSSKFLGIDGAWDSLLIDTVFCVPGSRTVTVFFCLLTKRKSHIVFA